MSDSDQDFEPAGGSRESSYGEDFQEKSRRPPVASASTRKRRRQSRSSSVESESRPDIKRALLGHYRDDYRKLFNDTVESAVARFNPQDSFYPRETQLGASKWSPEEKTKFFAALERLGKDDIPGIARAVATKSIPEVRQYLLLLDDTSLKQTKVTLRDIPAAAEISTECNGRLDLAGEALAWYQEKHEAKQEQERYSSYWLITPEIAEEIENAHKSSRRPSLASSLPPHLDQDQVAQGEEEIPMAQILRDIPEAQLLVPSAFLGLSMSIFMNGSPDPPSRGPHWSTLASPLAAKPSLYRTALIDFQTLAISLTRRLVQASIMQATSRIRSQCWRGTKGANPFIKRRDVVTAIDMLRMQRDGKERWMRAPRRCGLRVVEGPLRKQRVLDWKEVEEILGSFQKMHDFITTDDETPELVSGTEDNEFRRRATRSGTPLPSQSAILVEPDQEDASEMQYFSDRSDADDLHMDITSLSSRGSPEPVRNGDLGEDELWAIEEFDNRASRKEELRLMAILNNSNPPDDAIAEIKEEEADAPNVRALSNGRTGEHDWRVWTEYRAEWEEFPVPPSPATFTANQKSPSPTPFPTIEQDHLDTEAESGFSSGVGRRIGRRRKKRKVMETEIPIRGARAYAALQERMSGSEVRQSGQERSAGDYAQWPVPSIEDPQTGARDVTTSDEEVG
jgi:hypothetical protein